jgi:TP901-1 family phage major tail protein
MTAGKGSLVLVKVGNGAGTEVFSTIGGLRVSNLLLRNQAIESSTLDSGAWQSVLGSAGLRSLTISGSGVFTDSAVEEMLRGYAFSGSSNNYQFIFANGDYCAGPFVVTHYERNGDHEDEEMYAVALQSAGQITFTAA